MASPTVNKRFDSFRIACAAPSMDAMTWQAAMAWGLFGGFAMEALDFIAAVRRHFRWPWTDDRGQANPGPIAYGIAVALRLAVSAGVATAAAASLKGHSLTAWMATTVGAMAPTAMEKVTTLIPLTIRAGTATDFSGAFMGVMPAGRPLEEGVRADEG